MRKAIEKLAEEFYLPMTRYQRHLAQHITSAWSPSHFQRAWIVYLDEDNVMDRIPMTLRVTASTYAAICAAGVMTDDFRENANPREGYAKRAIPLGYASHVEWQEHVARQILAAPPDDPPPPRDDLTREMFPPAEATKENPDA